MASFSSGQMFLSLILSFSFSVSAALLDLPDLQSIEAQLAKAGTCCTALAYLLPEQTHFIADLAYQNSQASFWSAQEKSLSPNCIVIPTSSQNVSVTVAVLNLAFQKNISGCKFAVRSAGHTANAGAANIDGGVTLDLQSLNQVEVATDKKTVNIGPGNRWVNIYPKLDDLDLIMVGGRVSPVGVGGLVTGGGVSFFSGHHGFACDNIASFEVVLANGTIVTASQKTNPNLFRALKGGSNNFGVVTRLTANLYPQTPFWGGTISQPVTDNDKLFDFLQNFTDNKNFDPSAALIADFAWLAGVPTIVHNIAYTDGSVPWPPPAFKPLWEMPQTVNTIRKDHLTSFTNELASSSSVTNGRNNLLVTLTFVNKPGPAQDFMRDVYNLADTTAKALTTVPGLVFTMTFQPLPWTIRSYASSTGGNSLGLDRSKEDYLNLLWTISWTLPTDNARVEAAMKQLVADAESKMRDHGVWNEYIYLNYGAPWQDPIKGYGENNVAFLKSVSKQYDPNGVFQKGVPGGFKLGL